MAPSKTTVAILWWALFAFLCALMVVVGFESAVHFLGPAIDGPFQLYNSLRRIALGQRPGVDFQFFHGVGIPYVHYLQFRALGGTFMASEVTRQLTSALVYPLSVVIFLRFFIKDWTRVAAWSAIVMMASIALRMTSVLVAVNSLLGIRSTLPVLLPIALCLPIRRSGRVSIAGVTLGFALVMGSEQGLAALFALLCATAFIALVSRNRRDYLIDTMATAAIAMGTLVLVLVALGGVDGMRGALRYNFRLVPLDQYWYFGAPPNRFLASWSTAPALLMTILRIPISVLAGLTVVVVCARRLRRSATPGEERERFALLVLALYGVISCASLLGTYANAYIQPLLRALLLLAAVALDRRLPARDARLGRAPLLGVSPSVVGIAAAAFLVMLAVVPSVITTTFVTVPHLVREHIVEGKGLTYAGIWPETINGGQAIIDAHRHADGTPPSLWSTYAGLLEARNGIVHPSFDYIIHALGPENRAKYLADFQRTRPELVQTVAPLYTQYEPWIESTSWDFYANLLQNYRLVGGTPWSFFWEPASPPNPAAQEVWSADVPPGASSIILPAPPGTDGIVLLQVQMDYDIRNPLHVLPVIGAMPRYLIEANGAVQQHPVTLNPYVRSSRFPLLAPRGKSVTLSWNTFSLLPGAGIDVAKVRLSFVPVSAENLPWLDQLYRRQAGGGPDQ